MAKLKKDIQTPEQIYSKNRYEAMYRLAEDAGFDEDAFVYTEFCLMQFFELIIEQCAQVAETQSRVYSDGDSGKGAMDAANAIRTYGKTLGNGSTRQE